MSKQDVPMESRRKCTATTKSGKTCRANALSDKPFCLLHSNPELARELGRKCGKGNAPVKPDANPPEIPPLQTAAHVRDFLAQLMADVRGHRVEARLAATLATLPTAPLKAVQGA